MSHEAIELLRQLEELRAVVLELHKSDDAAGCGFYQNDAWLAAYLKSRALVGLPERGDA